MKNRKTEQMDELNQRLQEQWIKKEWNTIWNGMESFWDMECDECRIYSKGRYVHVHKYMQRKIDIPSYAIVVWRMQLQKRATFHSFVAKIWCRYLRECCYNILESDPIHISYAASSFYTIASTNTVYSL